MDYVLAAQVLRKAYVHASSQDDVPSDWLATTSLIASSRIKTYVPMLGTAILARAVDDSVDPLAIKADSSDTAYSARTLCHEVLVPASVELGFDLRARGREPLNNQPFFRYDRVDKIERVKYPADLRILQEALKRLETMDRAQAQDALAAFLRQRLGVSKPEGIVQLGNLSVDLGSFADRVKTFLIEDAEGGKRAQAVTAAVFSLAYSDVRTGKVNDPSRHLPGDVHVFVSDRCVIAVEVRAKPVAQTEMLQFAAACSRSGIPQCVMVALAPGQKAMDVGGIWTRAWEEFEIVAGFVHGIHQLLSEALCWSRRPIDEAIQELCSSALRRLTDIQVADATIDRWVSLFGSVTEP